MAAKLRMWRDTVSAGATAGQRLAKNDFDGPCGAGKGITVFLCYRTEEFDTPSAAQARANVLKMPAAATGSPAAQSQGHKQLQGSTAEHGLGLQHLTCTAAVGRVPPLCASCTVDRSPAQILQPIWCGSCYHPTARICHPASLASPCLQQQKPSA